MSDEMIDREPIIDNSYEHKYLNTFMIGDSYVGVWKIEDVAVKTAKNNKKYIEYMLKDKSDTVKAFYFCETSPVNKGDYACVDLQCSEYNSSKTFKIVEVLPNEGEDATVINKSYYFDSFDEVAMTKKLDVEVEILKNMNPYVYAIVNYVFAGENPNYGGYPSNSPCYAKHGGALAHTVSMVEMASSMAKAYGLNDNETSVLIGALMLQKYCAYMCFDNLGDGEYKHNHNYNLFGIDLMTVSTLYSVLEKGGSIELNGQYIDRIMHCLTCNEIGENKPATKEAFLFNKIVYTDTVIRSFMNAFDKAKVGDSEFSVKDNDWKREFLIAELPDYVPSDEDEQEKTVIESRFETVT